MIGDGVDAAGATAVGLQTTTDGSTTRIAWTVALLVGLAVGWWLVRKVADRLGRRYDERRVETAEIAAVTLLVGATAAGTIVVWDAVSELRTRLVALAGDPLLGVRIVVSLLFLAVAYGLTRLLGRLLRRRAGERLPTDHRREVAYHLIQVSTYVFAALAVLSIWKVDLGNLLVGAGVLGIVLGLAARQTLGAVLAGFVLLFSRPLEVGDWVTVGDREGIVTDVTIFNTRLRTFDDEHVLIPNDRVTNQEVVNRSREGRLRVTVEVGVDYDTDLNRAMAVAEETMRDCERVSTAPAPHVVGKGFGDSAVVLELRFWIDDPSARRMWRARTEVLGGVKAAFDREDIAIPFPQRSISGREPVSLDPRGEPGDWATGDATDGEGPP